MGKLLTMNPAAPAQATPETGTAKQRKHARLVPIELKILPTGFHADGDGLYLDVQGSGSRSWILRTLVRGKRKDIGLGGFPDVTLADARKESESLRARARKGEDILETRRAEKRIIPTFEEVARAYHTTISETFDSEAHAQNWIRSLELYVIPVFGNKAVNEVEPSDILRAVEPVWTTVPDTARRTLRRIKAIFDYCQAAGYRNLMVGGIVVPLPNPCETIKKALPQNRTHETHHEALPYADLPQFIHTLRDGTSSQSVKLAFEFMILTASRTSEALLATWDEIDIDAKTWTLSASRMKMRKPHVVPLSDRCVEILKLAKQLNGRPYVFPAIPDSEISLSNTCFLMILRRMGSTAKGHGFRGTFKTWAEETTQFDSLVIEASMAHVVKGIERHYLRTTFMEKRTKLMQKWADFAGDVQKKPKTPRKKR